VEEIRKKGRIFFKVVDLKSKIINYFCL